MPDYSLQLVIGTENCSTRSLTEIVEAAVKGGVTLVQLREKISSTMTRDKIIASAKLLQTLLKPYQVPLIINDHVDIALEINADGVHLGQNDMTPQAAREILGPTKIIGHSISTISEAKIAQKKLHGIADYFGVGPIFTTITKQDAAPALGSTKLKKILALLSKKPVIAIGGITTENIQEILLPDIHGIAVSSAIYKAEHPTIVCLQLAQIIKKTTRK